MFFRGIAVTLIPDRTEAMIDDPRSSRRSSPCSSTTPRPAGCSSTPPDYLDRSFDERRKNFELLFAAVDRAIASDNTEALARSHAVVQLAKDSPFKDLADAMKAKAAFRDKSKDWDV